MIRPIAFITDGQRVFELCLPDLRSKTHFSLMETGLDSARKRSCLAAEQEQLLLWKTNL